FGGRNAAARVHKPNRWSGRNSPDCTGAAGGDACDWVHQRPIARRRRTWAAAFRRAAGVMAFLVNPADRALAQSQVREMLPAAHDHKLELHVLNARSESDFDAVFADIKRLRVGGLVIGVGSIFIGGHK